MINYRYDNNWHYVVKEIVIVIRNIYKTISVIFVNLSFLNGCFFICYTKRFLFEKRFILLTLFIGIKYPKGTNTVFDYNSIGKVVQERRVLESFNADINAGEGFKVGGGGIGFENISNIFNLDLIISSPKSVSGGVGVSLIPASARIYKSWMVVPNYENAKKEVSKPYYPNTSIVPYNDTFTEYSKSSIKGNMQSVISYTIDCGGE